MMLPLPGYLIIKSSDTRILKRFLATVRGWTTYPGLSGQIKRNRHVRIGGEN